MASTDIDDAADELYSLPPGQFVATRDARVKEARSAGDRETARALAALRRPTVVAWLANLLVRRHPDDVAPFLELGEALRDATASLSGPELRDLSRQRQRLVHALVGKARALAEEAGQRVGEDAARGLEETLHAALADPTAAEQLLAGRLAQALKHSGYAASEPGAPPRPAARKSAAKGSAASRPSAAPSAPSPADQRRTERRARIERDLGQAWGDARRTAEARDAADEQAKAEEKRRTDAAREARRRRHDLERSERALAEAEKDRDQAVRTRGRAEKEAQRARQRVTDLQSRLDEL